MAPELRDLWADEMSGPLTGLQVVDFSRVLAGPLCADTLRRLGADVIKIEPPTPDVSRFAYPRRDQVSGYYAQFNSGKRAISLDLRAPGARGVALALCDRADIVVQNFRAGTLASFGLDYASLADRNPGLIYVSITGYGQRGPWSARSAYAPAVQAEAGLTANSWRHYGPALSGPQTDSMSHGDLYSGLHAVIAVLAALHQLKRSGRGQHIDVAMAAVAVAVNERLHADLATEDLHDEPTAVGATDTPFFRTGDSEIVATAGSLVGSLTFALYARAMRRPDLLDDPRFATASARAANLTDLHELVGNWVRSFATRGALESQLDEAKIAMGTVRTVEELADTDWARTWGAIHTVDDRSGGTYHIPGSPWKFSDAACNDPGSPARYGEHNHDVLAEIGYSDADIAALIAGGALPALPPDSAESPAGSARAESSRSAATGMLNPEEAVS
jgi:crotonobetainyl-CoA:carnitine CoA-transferase CaiB-like acyl-CoA transferase